MLDIGSFRLTDAKDVMLRAPWRKMKSRPKLIAQQNSQRTADENETGDKAESK